MSAKKPVIGITKPLKKDNLAYGAVAAAVRLCGGDPVALTPAGQKTPTFIKGVVFGGGQDIFPMLYDATPKQGYLYDRNRDALEMALGRQAREDNIPALGICRGAQMMNVIRGGALHADVSAKFEDAVYPDGLWGKAFYRKQIHIEEDSRMHQIFKTDKVGVNSLHKQAIKRLGDDLRYTAKEANGVIQAIEDDKLTFFLGVQFHPEFLTYRKDIRALFQHLIKFAAAKEATEVRWHE